MKLNFQERLMLLQILPAESDFLTLKIVRDLQTKLSATEEEFKKFNIKQDGERISWSNAGNKEKDIDIGEKGQEIITEQLKKLGKEKKGTLSLLSLYEKFVGVEEESLTNK